MLLFLSASIDTAALVIIKDRCLFPFKKVGIASARLNPRNPFSRTASRKQLLSIRVTKVFPFLKGREKFITVNLFLTSSLGVGYLQKISLKS